MSTVSLIVDHNSQNPRDVRQSRRSIYHAADTAYKAYPQWEKRGEELEIFREELEKRVYSLAHNHLEMQENLLKEEGEGCKKKQTLFKSDYVEVYRLSGVLCDLERGFEGLQPMPEKDTTEKTKKITQGKMNMGLMSLNSRQLQRKMETSLKDVRGLMQQFNEIAGIKDSREVDPEQEDASPGILQDPSSPSSSPAFILRSDIYGNIGRMNQELEMQKLRHPDGDDVEEEYESFGQVMAKEQTRNMQILDSIHRKIDEIQKSDEEGLKRIRELISPPLGTASHKDPLDESELTKVIPQRMDSKPRTPPKSSSSSTIPLRRPSLTNSIPLPTFVLPQTNRVRVRKKEKTRFSQENNPKQLLLGSEKREERSCGFFDWLCSSCSGNRKKPQLLIQTNRSTLVQISDDDDDDERGGKPQNIDKNIYSEGLL